MDTHISKTIGGLLESAKITPSTTTPRLPNASWNSKWLRLKTDRHPKLKDLEREAGKFCLAMWNDPQHGRLLLLAGENGTGKTHVAKAVAKWVLAVGHAKTWFPKPGERKSLDCIYWRWPELLDTLKEGGWDVIDDMFKASLLILDELGGGHDPSGVGVDKLCQILSRREKMWTLITTNVVPASWEQIFDRRVASRFFRNSTLVDLSDVPDFNTYEPDPTRINEC